MTDTERSAAEMRGLLQFAQGLGLNGMTVRQIDEAVGRETMVIGASDEECIAGVRKRMLAAARVA